MKKLMLILVVMLVLTFAIPAQEGEGQQEVQATQTETQVTTHAAGTAGTPTGPQRVPDATPLFLYSIIVGTLGLTAAAIGGAFAQSKALRTAVENIGRNPAAADSIRGVLIIGLALIESLVIYVLLVNLILFFVNWGKYSF